MGDRPSVLDQLDVFVGTWEIEAPPFPGQPPDDLHGQVTFAWTLDRQFLEVRSSAPDPIPDSFSLIGIAPDGDTFTQHYFDSRGIARVYAMELEDGVWTLVRDQADFTPLEFSQRFTGVFEEGGSVIRGAWEICHDGTTWEHDFGLTYRR
jgi:hypothetical protein